jgi:hypothetical protein
VTIAFGCATCGDAALQGLRAKSAGSAGARVLAVTADWFKPIYDFLVHPAAAGQAVRGRQRQLGTCRNRKHPPQDSSGDDGAAASRCDPEPVGWDRRVHTGYKI